MLRQLFLPVILATSAITQTAALNSSRVVSTYALSTSSAVVQKAAVANSGFDRSYKLSLSNPVQDKNFYLLSLFQRNRDVRRLLSKNSAMKQLAHEKLLAFEKAQSCSDVGCFEELMRFDGSTIDRVSKALAELSNQPEFKRLMKKDIRSSGVFIKYADRSDADMLVAAWKDAANALNRILSVYGLGREPRYKNIDKVSFDVTKPDYPNLIKAKIREMKLSKESLFFEPTLKFALQLLEINRRDEAARYEPLEEGLNKPTIQKLKHIKWGDYPYSFILVLGSGPQDSSRISALGAKRADVGAQLFLERKAPLLVLSGGHVHPMQTPYCEAIEMKKYVMEKYKIPETSILIDPYARHTTTNFRNAARLAFRHGLPMNIKALVTSSESHIEYTAGKEFRDRCVNELGYFPAEFITRISPVEAEFKPSVTSLFFDANDPLDP